MQASKEDDAQPMIADRLRPFNPRLGPADVCVVGCGPAGLALAAELASNGVHVALVGKQHCKMQATPERDNHLRDGRLCKVMNVWEMYATTD